MEEVYKCRKKYKNIIQSHLNMCKQCEEKLRQDKELYKQVLNNFIKENVEVINLY